MKTKYPSMFGLLVAFMLVASLVVPANVANPAPVQADPDMLRWSILDTPQSVPPATLLKEVFNLDGAGTEIVQVEVSSDGMHMYSIANVGAGAHGLIGDGATTGGVVLFSTTGGWIWSVLNYTNLIRDGAVGPAWQVAVAPDDPLFVAVVMSDANSLYPAELWVSDDGGVTWDDTLIHMQITAPTGAATDNYISCIDISPDYGGQRDIAVGTRNAMLGAAPLPQKLFTLQVPGFGNWLDQSIAAGNPTLDWVDADVFDIEFSPSYVGDATITILASGNDTAPATGTNSGAFWNTGVRDLDQNQTVWGTPVYISNPATANVPSANASFLVGGDLELPSDFSGQAASLRRAYISLDDAGGVLMADGTSYTESGIFRVDDTTVYQLMDTTAAGIATGKRISSIAYYGTYASGKLLAGEVRADPCWATVPTWFTDSPTTCPIPCWYPAKKATTGGAGIFDCATADPSWGNAYVAWSPDGATAYAATSSNEPGPYTLVAAEAFATLTWPNGLRIDTPRDETAFALSRNNGETWNQLALIDTVIDKLTDAAPSADCTTLYLASTNVGTEGWLGCDGFDSVWRTTSNPAVASPLFPLFSDVWERVYCRPTQTTCNEAQSEYAILRLAPDKEDGQIVFWAAGGAAGGGDVNIAGFVAGPNTQAVAWSPDYGDYWANINPRLAVQDMSAESSTTLYVLQANGLVQRMPYTGTAWSSAIANGQTSLTVAHTIDSLAEGNVLVGSQTLGNFECSYSADSAVTFSFPIGEMTPTSANNHVEFDTNFADTGIFFIADDDGRVAGGGPGAIAGTIYRNTIPFGAFDNMLGAPAGAYHQNGYFGLAVAYTGDALYGSHNGVAQADATGAAGWCTVERTIYRYWPIPKPHIPWDHLNTGTDGYVGQQPQFTLEPSSLKFCGCLTMDTDTELFAIDNNVYSTINRTTGMLWAYTDCLAKVGPTLITEDGLLVGCDPVSGRNQEINFQWEQLCLAQGYDIELAKDEAFTMKVVDYIGTFTQATWGNTRIPFNPMAPAWIVPVAATMNAWIAPAAPGMFTALECGHKYYWKVKVRTDAWAGSLRSPWSEVRSFTIKAGLPVSTPYYGPQLLSPNNGCLGCAVSPASFSWSPFKGSTSYKFQLAKDAAMTDIIAEDTTGASTGYEYDGTLDYSTNYFWRVMAVEPAPSDWSATFSFQTGAAPEAPPAAPEAPATPLWVWVVIALGAILVIVTLVLIFKTRRV